ncbi:protein-ADP-ribose hydrolase [uncultured Mailhella sp.]|uniref:protein-ADP-ribose hydrolase n=1 Tax=uncultured Mailhella sp. TaxID=1981031 RepID=UPI0025D36A2B|nr:protein-ADP-ribose hydrolase [uncultured Mailhella sp.]
MTQDERRTWLVEALLRERGEAAAVPADEASQKRLLRALFNVRPPVPASREFLSVQDAYLQEELRARGVTSEKDVPFMRGRLALWQGDITTLGCDAIVNAANSAMLGCFCPNHGCIDNAVHTFAGVQLRLACARIMKEQGHEEKTGGAKITPGFNLPSRFVIHTVGPVVRGPLTPGDRAALASCYASCLDLAAKNGVTSLAFCCISTGEFHFPPQQAAETAVETVTARLASLPSIQKVIFNVFKDSDAQIYRRLLR